MPTKLVLVVGSLCLTYNYFSSLVVAFATTDEPLLFTKLVNLTTKTTKIKLLQVIRAESGNPMIGAE